MPTKCSDARCAGEQLPVKGTAASARKSSFMRFLGDRRGNIAMMFAVMTVPVTGLVGASVDYGKALQLRAKVQSAVDAAVLAAGREYQVSRDTALASARAATCPPPC